MVCSLDPALKRRAPAAARQRKGKSRLAREIFFGRQDAVSSSGRTLTPAQDDSLRRLSQPEDSANCNAAQLIAAATGILEGRSSAQSEAPKTAIVGCKKSGDSTNCGDIQPAPDKLFPQFEKRSQLFLGISLACSATLILLLLHLRILPRSVCIEARLVSLVLAAAALACVFWVPLAQLPSSRCF